MHPLIAKVTATPWIDGTRRKDFTLDCDAAASEIESLRPTLTFITTPNNPTGSALLISEIEMLARSTQLVGGLLVIDEAYAEFSSEKSAITLIEKFSNVVVIRTMSKAFAFAGARVGYLVAHPSVIDAMRLVRLPYHLSALTQVAASAALEFSDELQALCGKHQIALVHNEDAIHVLKFPGRLLGTILLVHEGRIVWRPEQPTAPATVSTTAV